jgi:hypothetical protein
LPGAIAGWVVAPKHGTITLARALEPAIRRGMGSGIGSSDQWVDAAGRCRRIRGSAVFLPPAARRSQEIFRNPTLQIRLSRSRAGPRRLLSRPDRRGHRRRHPEARRFLTAPACAPCRLGRPDLANYRGYDVRAAAEYSGFRRARDANIPRLRRYVVRAQRDYLHRLAEAKRIAFADRAAYLADPAHVPPSTLKALISRDYGAARRREIDPGRAASGYAPGVFGGTASHDAFFDGRDHGVTVYLAAADGEGNAISFINSLFSEFGSGIVTPGTGVVLHNRGAGFTLEKGHPNRLAPGKRPLHTLVPAFVMKEKPFVPFGVIGGDNQGKPTSRSSSTSSTSDERAGGRRGCVRRAADLLAAESGSGSRPRALRRQGVVDGRADGWVSGRHDRPDPRADGWVCPGRMASRSAGSEPGPPLDPARHSYFRRNSRNFRSPLTRLDPVFASGNPRSSPGRFSRGRPQIRHVLVASLTFWRRDPSRGHRSTPAL